MKKLIEYFKSIPFLSNNSKTYLTKVQYSFEQRNYIRNQQVYFEGDPSDYVFLVKNGEFEITKRITYKLKNSDKNKSDCLKLLKGNKSKSGLSSKETMKPQIETFRVAIVCDGQLIGEEDVIKEYEDENRIYSTSVKCISKTANVFCIKYDEFLRKFKNNRESWRVICKNASEKESQMMERYKTIINQLKDISKKKPT